MEAGMPTPPWPTNEPMDAIDRLRVDGQPVVRTCAQRCWRRTETPFRYPPRVRRPPKRTLRAMLPTTTDRIHRRSQHSPRLLRVHPRRRRWPLRRLREGDEPSPPAGLRRPETGRRQPGSERRDRRRHRLRSDHETGLHAPGLDHRHRRDGRSTNSNRRGPARVESRQRTERYYAAREPRRREEDQPEPSPRRAAHPAGGRRAHRDFETLPTERRQHPEHTETNISRNAPSVPAPEPCRAGRIKNDPPPVHTECSAILTRAERPARTDRKAGRLPTGAERTGPANAPPRKRSATPGTKGQNRASNGARHREARLSVPERLFRARSTRPDPTP